MKKLPKAERNLICIIRVKISAIRVKKNSSKKLPKAAPKT